MKISASIKTSTVFRTRIRIHYSWILVFVLIPWTVSTQFSDETSLISRILLGLVTAVLFFLAVFLREVILLIVGGSRNIQMKTVTIFAFGGLIQTDDEKYSPSIAMLLSVSGLLCNFGITAVFYFINLFFGDSGNLILDVPVKWLAFFYLTLSLFHLFPIYPLEGGRLLHVLLWRLTKNGRKATFIASVSGWVMGFLLMIGAVALAVFTVERFSGLFFIGLGLILQNAATHGFRLAKLIPVSLPVEPVPVTPEIMELPDSREYNREQLSEVVMPVENPIEEKIPAEDTEAEENTTEGYS